MSRRITIAALVLVLAGCSQTAASHDTADTATNATTTSLAQLVGQLFIVGVRPTDAASACDPLAERHAGGIFLHGPSSLGVTRTKAFVAACLRRFGTTTAPVSVSTDQEGGLVQVLKGPGFSTIPAATTQGTWSTTTLRRRAAEWGGQLRRAGVTLDLAPVADIVASAKAAAKNPPVGALHRQYGYSSATVAPHAAAFAAGLRSEKILPTFKHFPGLGRVTANTDTTAHVHDRTITADSPDVSEYGQLIRTGRSAVMVSSAVYDRIDVKNPACFSSKVVTGLLRGRLGFRGLIVTDDLSAAKQVAAIPVGERAVRAITAGVDIVLVSTRSDDFAAMYDAVLAKAQKDPTFRAQVRAAAKLAMYEK